MDHDFEPAPRRCSDLVCRRSNLCRRPSASACLTSPSNDHLRRQRIAEKLRQFLARQRHRPRRTAAAQCPADRPADRGDAEDHPGCIEAQANDNPQAGAGRAEREHSDK
jgi:hypothetical protein